MKTKLLINELDNAADILRSGGLVAVPTETVYGLAANGLSAEAVLLLYERKGRPKIKPLSLMVPGAEAIDSYCTDVPAQAELLARRFWPGPLTLVLKARELVPDIVRAGGDTVGLRCPDHPLTLQLLRQTGFPLAAPSANPSDRPSPSTAAEVLRYFDGEIDAVIDGGPCSIGRESTLLSLAETPFRVLRQGALSEREIADALVEQMHIIGITGGSGSGKTTALDVLKQMGALVIDADAVYRELTDSCGEMLAAIETRFPGTVCDGRLERKKLAELVFRDPSALTALNAITHPFVIDKVRGLLRAHAMCGGRAAAIDAVGLIGSGLDTLCERCFAVVADRETRIARIMYRDGLTRAAAEQRIDAQQPDTFFVDHCGDTLPNDADKESFAALCRRKFKEVFEHG